MSLKILRVEFRIKCLYNKHLFRNNLMNSLNSDVPILYLPTAEYSIINIKSRLAYIIYILYCINKKLDYF